MEILFIKAFYNILSFAPTTAPKSIFSFYFMIVTDIAEQYTQGPKCGVCWWCLFFEHQSKCRTRIRHLRKTGEIAGFKINDPQLQPTAARVWDISHYLHMRGIDYILTGWGILLKTSPTGLMLSKFLALITFCCFPSTLTLNTIWNSFQHLCNYQYISSLHFWFVWLIVKCVPWKYKFS